ncbi:MAG: VCBS repeat-containing protein [Bryobacterales bacterium]|nr:VCBS repeat-containing protein [Bryobacterales bacterium]
MRQFLLLFSVALLLTAQHHPSVAEPILAPRDAALRPALLLLREGKTAEAREALQKLPASAETQYQTGRAYLMDFYSTQDRAKARIALSLAMEAFAGALRRNPDHIPALRAKSVIHARAELLFYDPNLAFQLAARVAQLQPHANEYLLNLTEWLSGEVRFSHESGHRVPHDPLLGLDRSREILELLLDGVLPNTPEEAAATFLYAKTLARRGDFADSLPYFQLSIQRAANEDQRLEAHRELGASFYRLNRFEEAARQFYQAHQIRDNAIDRWLLHVAIDAIPNNKPPIPESSRFPIAGLPANQPKLVFEDIAPRLGLDRFDGNGTCSWADLDNDGDQDLVLAGSGTFLAVYRNDGAKFSEITREAGLEKTPSGYSLNLIDYDNDGNIDLYLALNGWSGPMPNRLYRNTGKARFVDVSQQSGAADGGSGFISLWGDLDNDGFLDFVVANGVLRDGSTPRIYRNNRNGTFRDVTEEAGMREPPQWGAIGAALGDYDRDGDLDILINGLDTSPNRLYRNDGNWRFTEVARTAGVVQPAHNGFVCFFTDYNNDGWPDILTTSLAPWEAVVEGLRAGYAPGRPQALHPDTVRLFRNNRNGTFTDVTFESRLYYPMGVMGAGVADIDNDGYVDFYFGTGDPQLSRLEPNRFFRNNGDGTFTDLTNIAGVARPGNKGHGVSFIDLDNDGRLEIYAQLGGHYPGDHARNALYRSRTRNGNHWLAFDLTGVRSNRNAVGAAITVKAGGQTFHREIKGSEGFGASNPYRAHIGLGAVTQLDSIEVMWPSKTKQAISVAGVDRVYRVLEPQP